MVMRKQQDGSDNVIIITTRKKTHLHIFIMKTDFPNDAVSLIKGI